MMPRKSLLPWGAYVLFVGIALYFNWHSRMLDFGGPLGLLKLTVWAALAGFLAYSIYCSSREDLFRSIREIGKLYWGRQVGADLYLGLGLGLVLIYLNEGLLAVLLWLIPMLAFANLAFLLYFAIHFDAIADKILI